MKEKTQAAVRHTLRLAPLIVPGALVLIAGAVLFSIVQGHPAAQAAIAAQVAELEQEADSAEQKLSDRFESLRTQVTNLDTERVARDQASAEALVKALLAGEGDAQTAFTDRGITAESAKALVTVTSDRSGDPKDFRATPLGLEKSLYRYAATFTTDGEPGLLEYVTDKDGVFVSVSVTWASAK